MDGLSRRSVIGTALASLASRVLPTGDSAGDDSHDCENGRIRTVAADGGTSGETLSLDTKTATATLEGEEGADETTWTLDIDLEIELTREWE
jgi:hypothetical protein